MSLRGLLLSTLFAAYLLALNYTSLGDDWPTMLVVLGYLIGPYVIGALEGWGALPTFAAAFLLASIVYQLLLWPDDPGANGVSEVPAVAGIVLVVPVLLIPMALGATSRAAVRNLQERSR